VLRGTALMVSTMVSLQNLLACYTHQRDTQRTLAERFIAFVNDRRVA